MQTVPTLANRLSTLLGDPAKLLGANPQFSINTKTLSIDISTSALLPYDGFDQDNAKDTGGKTGSMNITVDINSSVLHQFVCSKINFNGTITIKGVSKINPNLVDILGELGCSLQEFLGELKCANFDSFIQSIDPAKSSEQILKGAGLAKLGFQFKYPAANGKKFNPIKSLTNTIKFRRIGEVSEKENIGEYITANIYKQLAEGDVDDRDKSYSYDEELAPRVYIVYDKEEHLICIASKYLKDSDTLDDHITKSGNGPDKKKELRGKKHIRIIGSESGLQHRKAISKKNKYYCYDIDNHNDRNLDKAQLADMIVKSAIFGDHDINPGNVMVLKRKDAGKDYNAIVRIDFGHPFADMLQGISRWRKGDVKENYILDYFNRGGTAGHNKLLNQSTKLWRDYPNMVPSQEMVDALKKYSKDTTKYGGLISNGVEQASEGLGNLLGEMFRNDAPEKKKRELVRSVIDIVNNFLSKKEQIKIEKEDYTDLDGAKNKITTALTKINGFCQTNLGKMKEVAEIMQLQVNIDKYIKNPTTDSKELQELEDEYKKLKGRNAKEIWIKVEPSDKNQGFQGGFYEYVESRISFLDKSNFAKGKVTFKPKDTGVEQIEEKPSPSPLLTTKSNAVQLYNALNKELGNLSDKESSETIKNAAPKDLVDAKIKIRHEGRMINSKLRDENRPNYYLGIGAEIERIDRERGQDDGADKKFYFKVTNVFEGLPSYGKLQAGDIVIVPALDEKDAKMRIRNEGIVKGGDITVIRGEKKTRAKVDIHPALIKTKNGKYILNDFQESSSQLLKIDSQEEHSR